MLQMLAGPIINGVFGIIDKTVEDKDEANKIKAKIAERQQELVQTELKGAIEIILAEAKGNWLQRSWRPILMLTIVFIVANNFIIVPYAQAFGAPIPTLELPDGLWTLMITGVGGYIVSRGGEKMMETYKRND